MHKCHHTMIAVFLRIAVRQILSKMDKRHQCHPFKPFEIHRIARLHRASLWISHHRALFGLVLHTKPWTGRHDTFKISEVWKQKGLWSVSHLWSPKFGLQSKELKGRWKLNIQSTAALIQGIFGATLQSSHHAGHILGHFLGYFNWGWTQKSKYT